MFGNLILLKRWHWLALSILIGLCAGYAAMPTSIDLRSYGEGLNGQKDFEQSLLREIKGRRRFMDLTVHRQSITNPDGGTRLAWIVSGLYCSNAPDSRDGNYHWKPYFFVADDPYKPANPLRQLTNGQGAERIAQFQKLPHPTILDFLDVLHGTVGVNFVHTRWRTYALQTYLIASILLIGFVFPTLIDLIVFGRFLRPREARGITYATFTSKASNAQPKVTADDLNKLKELDAAMEESLKAGATTAKPVPAVITPAPAIRQLNPMPETAAAASAKEDHRAFGAKPDDYYPTEKKAKS